MPTPPPIDDNPIFIVPDIAPPEKVYDTIMSQINPELCLSNIDKQNNKKITPEEKQKYEKNWKEYQKQYAEYRRAQQEDLHTIQRQTRGKREQINKPNDTAYLTNLEHEIQL